MSTLIATPVIKNKFWIVEESGNKVATVQAIENGEFVYVDSEHRAKYPSIKVLSTEHNIEFTKTGSGKKSTAESTREIYGYPVEGRAYNAMWDVKHGFPVYTKINKSKSYFCAGYYLVKFTDVWVTAFCPKYIALNRYEHVGPFKTKEDMEAALNERN